MKIRGFAGQSGGNSSNWIPPEPVVLNIYKDGVLDETEVGSIGANRVAIYIGAYLQGSYNVGNQYIEIIGQRNNGQSGGYGYEIDFANKVEAGKYNTFRIKFDLLVEGTNISQGGEINIVFAKDVISSGSEYGSKALKGYSTGKITTNIYDQEAIIDISDISENFYFYILSYCLSNAGYYKTTIRIKELVLEE